MTLHHVPNLETMLGEITRCLEPGGYLIIKEHDASDDYDKLLIDIEHMLYNYVTMKPQDARDAVSKYYGKYYNWMEWDEKMKNHGLKLVNSRYYYTGPKFTLQPTRHYYAFYQLS